MSERPITLGLCGDVMTGRGVDQVLAVPGDPALHEPGLHDAREYLALAERRNGGIPRQVAPDYVWGDLLPALRAIRADAILVNLETAVTTCSTPFPKGINYRMHPGNVGVLKALGVGTCILANNHVLDWGEPGLVETLEVLHGAGLATAGAGRSRTEAGRPGIVRVGDAGRVLAFAYAHPSSGVPPEWWATSSRAGVRVLPRLSGGGVERIRAEVSRWRRPNDVVVVSIHWGPNWGYDVPPEQTAFARGLVDAGAADVVFGHSSHHPKAIEFHRGHAILYGCGDCINDYEGIAGREAFRPDLVLTYVLAIRPADGALVSLRALPFRIRRFRLQSASKPEREWLCGVLDREGEARGARFQPAGDELGAIEMRLER